MSSSKEFSSVYKEAKKWHNDVCVVFYKPSIESKLAIVASKKVGKAVIRNRCKRLIRAAFIKICDEVADGVYIMVAKNGTDSISFDKIQKSLNWSLRKLGCMR
ncbi:ribonuclease P protein component [Campylobacter sp. faydin G-24]|uniref:Ribonuclease P protein component n=1 Tax=Campylobacter anatolicus TaxID=2829105 RepID=A0ABS5HIQ6_9BACT|nr:ribonuclease P protein component [Campylobacter anatolicus]MBR8462683.1 ribonuclease P protein component [Campylobacter anatolicus]MBR8464149.1 ribonuclease P protein component [Campylobacter anatolicus]MBR8466054.1 ribonuclease P protein component [Campylobacter anatolicus]